MEQFRPCILWGWSRYKQRKRPKKFETAVKFFRKSRADFLVMVIQFTKLIFFNTNKVTKQIALSLDVQISNRHKKTHGEILNKFFLSFTTSIKAISTDFYLIPIVINHYSWFLTLYALLFSMYIFVLVSLFNGISTFLGYLRRNPFF